MFKYYIPGIDSLIGSNKYYYSFSTNLFIELHGWIEKHSNSTSPLVPPVWHVCSTGGPQLVAPDFGDVPARDGEEVTEVGV